MFKVGKWCRPSGFNNPFLSENDRSALNKLNIGSDFKFSL